MQKTLTIATRKSPLALWQAYHVRDRLKARFPELTIELLEMTTQGDERLDVSLTKIGGKRSLRQRIRDGSLRWPSRPCRAFIERCANGASWRSGLMLFNRT